MNFSVIDLECSDLLPQGMMWRARNRASTGSWMYSPDQVRVELLKQPGGAKAYTEEVNGVVLTTPYCVCCSGGYEIKQAVEELRKRGFLGKVVAVYAATYDHDQLDQSTIETMGAMNVDMVQISRQPYPNDVIYYALKVVELLQK